MNDWRCSSPSRKRRFEIRSVWSTKRNGSQFGCRFRFSAGDRAAALPDFPIPPAPPGGRGKNSPARLTPSPFGRPSASECRFSPALSSRCAPDGVSALRASYSHCPNASNSRTVLGEVSF